MNRVMDEIEGLLGSSQKKLGTESN